MVYQRVVAMYQSYHISSSTAHAFVQGFVHSMVGFAEKSRFAGMSSDELGLSLCSLMLQQLPNIFHRTICRGTIHNQVLDVRIVLLEHAMNGFANRSLSVIACSNDGDLHKKRLVVRNDLIQKCNDIGRDIVPQSLICQNALHSLIHVEYIFDYY